MSGHAITLAVLLGAAVAITLLCALGLACMREPLQRLHFSAPVVSLSAVFIAVAVWLDETNAQARIKVILTGLVLFTMNSILTHATARAVVIRRTGSWPPEEPVPIVNAEGEPQATKVLEKSR